MSQSLPSFWNSPYFVPEPDNWHLKEDAPEELKKEFEEYMKAGENRPQTDQKAKVQIYTPLLFSWLYGDYMRSQIQINVN